MNDKQANLESLRRVVERLRKITDDNFSSNLAKVLEEEIARLQGAPDTDEQQSVSAGN